MPLAASMLLFLLELCLNSDVQLFYDALCSFRHQLRLTVDCLLTKGIVQAGMERQESVGNCTKRLRNDRQMQSGMSPMGAHFLEPDCKLVLNSVYHTYNLSPSLI